MAAQASQAATNSHGIDKGLWNKISGKDDESRNVKVMEWVKAITGENIDVHDMMDELQDGYLCFITLLKIEPGIIKKTFNYKGKETKGLCKARFTPKHCTKMMAFRAREQIELFSKGCKILGMKETDCMTTQCLYNQEMPHIVCNHMYALNAIAQQHPNFQGPYIAGAFKHSAKNRREFTQEQINKSKAIVPGMMRGSKNIKGANQQDSRGIMMTAGNEGYRADTKNGSFATGASIKRKGYDEGDHQGIVKLNKKMQKHQIAAGSTFGTQGSLKRKGQDTFDAAGIVKINN